MSTAQVLNSDIENLKNTVYHRLSLDLTNYINEAEGTEYNACRYKLSGLNILGRTAKITPKKVGQFVTCWKRNPKGIIEPFNATDKIDFLIITVNKNDRTGQFIFPKSILAEKGIISKSTKEGKRGFRVYPSWDSAASKQANRTQKWQLDFFIEFAKDKDLRLAKKLFFNFDK